MPRRLRILGCSARSSQRKCVQNRTGVLDKECRIEHTGNRPTCIYDPTTVKKSQRRVLKKTPHPIVLRPRGVSLLKGCKYTERKSSKKLRARTYCKTTREGAMSAKCHLSSKRRCKLIE
jgi:hypothetical protein